MIDAIMRDNKLPSLETMANALRVLAMDGVERAKSGHPGMPMGMADVATVLFTKFLKYDPKNPNWADRDRFVLSAGHGSMLLYGLLYLTGYEDMTIEEIKNFRQWGSKTAGHPEYGHAKGIETTTGPLGQGLANAVGMAMAEKMLRAEFGKDLVSHKTYAIVGDGCLMEGISQEAISFAGHNKLSNLIVLFDDNHISIDGPIDLSSSDNQQARFKASGWEVIKIDGHNYMEIEDALNKAQNATSPVLICCRTTIGKGSPNKAGSASTHGSPLGEAEIALTRQNLGWEFEPFHIPEDIINAWRAPGISNQKAYKDWKSRLDKSSLKEEFNLRISGELPKSWKEDLQKLKTQWESAKPALATRQSSQEVLNNLCHNIRELVGGSADLTPSNNTKAQGISDFDAKTGSGRYIRYGIREHAMAAIMNGLCLHRGLIPYGGTFLVFTDYMRPALRLSALMGLPVVYVMTHDSIGLGEDGPTHQPIEHLASLRAIPNLNVIRPADAIETLEAWEIAISSKKTPTLLALTRQKLSALRFGSAKGNLVERGAYVLKECDDAKVSIIATGSEVNLAIEVAEKLDSQGIGTRVISMPSWFLFEKQPADYKASVMDNGSLKVSIEAGSTFGWGRYAELKFGIDHFGASAPYERLYKEFGLDPEHITTEILKKLKEKA